MVILVSFGFCGFNFNAERQTMVNANMAITKLFLSQFSFTFLHDLLITKYAGDSDLDDSEGDLDWNDSDDTTDWDDVNDDDSDTSEFSAFVSLVKNSVFA